MSALDLVLKNRDSLADTGLEAAFPAVLLRAGLAACFPADEFFSARISNPHTRRAYDRAIGLRDRAVLGTLIYTGARVGALCRLRMRDLRDHGNHRALQFAEKGGKVREIPVRHDLDE